MEDILRVLLVEESPDEALLLKECMARSDSPPEVLHAGSLDQALEYLKTKPIDAVLLDLDFPEGDRLATLERIGAAAGLLPVIVLTAPEEEAAAIEAVRRGAQDYILKRQTGARQFVQIIRQAVERKGLERALTQSARRNLLLAEVSAAVVAQTDLKGLLKTVAEAARTLAYACKSFSSASLTKGKPRASASSSADGTAWADLKDLNSGTYRDLFQQSVSVRLSEKALHSRAAWWGLPQDSGASLDLMGARFVDARNQPTGFILVGGKEGGKEFTQEDEALLRQLASITSLALQHIESRTAAEAASVAKSQFLANMSHELRTPMNAILGMTDLALAETLSPTVRDYLQTVRESARVLLDLLNEALDLSRIEAGRFDLESTAFSLHMVVEQVIKALRVRAAEKGLDLVYEMSDQVPGVLVGDPLRFRQVLTNLVDNAIKFTHEGKIVVSVYVKDRMPKWVRIEAAVSDTGIGISPEDQERVFAAFTQADASTTRNYGGTGLGLTISRKLVEMMEGRIWIEGNADGGSTFYFNVRLKIPQDSAAEKTVLPAPAPARAAGRVLRVLLAEDTPTNQKLAEYLLARQGHAVTIAGDGRRAVELIEKQDFDLVLMDVQMPVMDGFQATASIRALADPDKASVPIIAMTAHALKGDAERCLAAGMNAYVSKPIRAQEFIELVESVGESKPASGRLSGGAGTGEPSGLEPAIPSDFSTPAFDLNEAVQRCFGKYGFFQDMLEGFFEEADAALLSIRENRLRKNMEAVRSAAHRMKNTVIYLGAEPAGAAVAEVESAAASGKLEILDAAVRDLERQLGILKPLLAPHRKPVSSSPVQKNHQ